MNTISLIKNPTQTSFNFQIRILNTKIQLGTLLEIKINQNI